MSEGGEKMAGRTTSRPSTSTRREFLKRGLGLGTAAVVGGAGVVKLVEIGVGVVGAGLNALEQNRSHATDAQRKVIDEFNKLEEQIRQNPRNEKLQQQRVYRLKTGSDGAILRSVPEPPSDEQTDMEKNNFTWGDKLKANTDYNVPGGAILVTGKDPSNAKGVLADWYFIATQRDPQTNKVTGGYFSYSGNFTTPTPIAAQTK